MTIHTPLKSAVPDLGIILKVVLRYWGKLPAYAKASYEPEDMVADVLVKMVQSSQTTPYSPRRASPSTYVFTLAERHCKTILSHYTTQKRMVFTAPIESVRGVRANNSDVRFVEVRTSVERFIYDAPPLVRRTLESIVSGKGGIPKRITPEVRQQFLSHAHKHGLGYSDFRAVLAGV